MILPVINRLARRTVKLNVFGMVVSVSACWERKINPLKGGLDEWMDE